MAGTGAAEARTDVPVVLVVGGEELGRSLGTLLARVQCEGITVVILDKRTGLVRGSLVPGLPREMDQAPGLVLAASNGRHALQAGPGVPA